MSRCFRRKLNIREWGAMETMKNYQEPKWMCAGAQNGKGEEAKNHRCLTLHVYHYVIPSPFPGEKQFSDVILIPFFFRIQQVGSEAYVLGLSSFYIPSVGAACVCFLELLGLDSLKLRVDMKVANIILSYKCRNEDAQYSCIRESLGTVPSPSGVCFV